MTDALIKKNMDINAHIHTQKECHMKIKAEIGEISKSQGMPKISSKPLISRRKTNKHETDSPS